MQEQQQQQLNTMAQQQLHAAADGAGSMADWEVVETYGDMLMDEPAEDGCPAGQGATFLPDTQGTAAATLASAPAAGGVGSQERQQQQQQGEQPAACSAISQPMTCQASAPASPPRTTASPSGHAGSGTGMAAAAAGPTLTQQALSPTGSPPASPPLPVGSPNACTSHAPYPGATACNNRALIQPKSRQHGTGSGHWVRRQAVAAVSRLAGRSVPRLYFVQPLRLVVWREYH